MNLTIEAETVEQLREKLVKIAKDLGYTPNQESFEFKKEEAAEAPKKAEPKAKKSKPVEAPQPLAEDEVLEQVVRENTAAKSEEVVTLDNIRDLARKLTDAKGIDTLKSLLKEFGVDKLSQLQDAQMPKMKTRVLAEMH